MAARAIPNSPGLLAHLSANKNRTWAVYRRIIRIGCLLGRVVGVVHGIALVLFVDFSVFVQLLPDVG